MPIDVSDCDFVTCKKDINDFKFFLNAIIKKKNPWQFHKAIYNVLSHLSKIKFRSELNGTD